MNCIKYYLIIFLAASVFISCSKEERRDISQKEGEEIENPQDTILSPEEKFSSSILVDFLNESDDEDLAAYLEDEVFRMGANFRGASVMEITPSVWLVMLEKEGSTKNYLLQKFVDFTTNEYYFKMMETTLTITDVITKGKSKTSAGE